MKPGYKQTEVGVIPEDWELTTLVELIDPSRGIRYGIVQPGKFDPSGRFMIRGQDYSTGWVDPLHLFKVSLQVEEPFKNARVRTGDLVITIVGASTGHVEEIPDWLDEANLTQTTARLAINPLKAFSGFCKYYLQSFEGQRQVANYLKGAAQPGLNCGDVEKFKIPLPPNLPEQRAIATALSDVDALLGGLDRLIAKKRDLKQAAMQQLLTGQTRLPGFQGEWEVRRLGELGKCLRGVTYKGESDLSTHDTPHTKRLLRSNNVQSAVVFTDEVQFVNAARVSSHQILQQDDILICMANGSKALVGKAGFFMVNDCHEYTFGAFMGCFRTNASKVNPACVFYLFLTARYRDYINNLLAGSSINNLRPSSIESLEFSTPPPPEQAAIATVLSEMDVELVALVQRREKTQALKQGMMQELLTGRTRLV